MAGRCRKMHAGGAVGVQAGIRGQVQPTKQAGPAHKAGVPATPRVAASLNAALPLAPAAEGRGVVLDPHTVEVRCAGMSCCAMLCMLCTRRCGCCAVLCCACFTPWREPSAPSAGTLRCAALCCAAALTPHTPASLLCAALRCAPRWARAALHCTVLRCAPWWARANLCPPALPSSAPQVRAADGSVRQLRTKNVLVATGGRPVKPNIPGAVRSTPRRVIVRCGSAAGRGARSSRAGAAGAAGAACLTRHPLRPLAVAPVCLACHVAACVDCFPAVCRARASAATTIVVPAGHTRCLRSCPSPLPRGCCRCPLCDCCAGAGNLQRRGPLPGRHPVRRHHRHRGRRLHRGRVCRSVQGTTAEGSLTFGLARLSATARAAPIRNLSASWHMPSTPGRDLPRLRVRCPPGCAGTLATAWVSGLRTGTRTVGGDAGCRRGGAHRGWSGGPASTHTTALSVASMTRSETGNAALLAKPCQHLHVLCAARRRPRSSLLLHFLPAALTRSAAA